MLTAMNYFVTHKTACEFWHGKGSLPSSEKFTTVKYRPVSHGLHVSKSEACNICDMLGLSQEHPIHTVVSRAQDRRPSRFFCPHVLNLDLPRGSFVEVAKGINVASPELMFVQMAETLSLIETIQLGYELCGSYATPTEESTLSDDDAERGFVRRKPLTTQKDILRFIDLASKLRGSRNALRAARFVRDNSASPMETKLALLLCLPRMLGGYGIPFPVMNADVFVPSGNYSNAQRTQQRRCDLYWPDARLALEYDSDSWHADDKSRQLDSQRRVRLNSADVFVVTVTRGQLYNANETDMIARFVARRLNVRLRFSAKRALSTRYALRCELLGTK